MTIDSVELRYRQTEKEREGALRFLQNRSDSSRNAVFEFLSNRYVVLAACVFLLLFLIEGTIEMLPEISAHGLAVMASPEYLFGNILGLILAIVSIQYVWLLLAERRQRNKLGRTAGEDVKTGAHHLRATPNGLTIRLANRRTAYKWAALLDVIETKDMLLLLLTPRQAITVPRNAFQSETEEESFRDFIRGHMTPS